MIEGRFEQRYFERANLDPSKWLHHLSKLEATEPTKTNIFTTFCETREEKVVHSLVPAPTLTLTDSQAINVGCPILNKKKCALIPKQWYS